MDIEEEIIVLFYIYFENIPDIAIKLNISEDEIEKILMNFKTSNENAIFF